MTLPMLFFSPFAFAVRGSRELPKYPATSNNVEGRGARAEEESEKE